MVDPGGGSGAISCKLLGTCLDSPKVLTHILGNPVDPVCNGLEDYQGEVLSPRPIEYGIDDDLESYITLRGPYIPVFWWDYAISVFEAKNYLETNFDFRNMEYAIWDLPPDVTSGLFYTPSAYGIRRNDASGVLMTALIVTNNFTEDIQRVDLKIQMLDSNSFVLASDQTQITNPIQSSSGTNLFSKPIFAPTNTYQASVSVTLYLYTSNYQRKIVHTIP